MPMGRKRKHRPDLPARVYFNHGAYYFVDLANKWHWLGRKWDHHAMRRYADINVPPDADRRLGAILDLLLQQREQKVQAAALAARTLANNHAEAKPLKIGFGHMLPSEVTRQHIYQYLDARPRVAGNREIALLSGAFKLATRMGLCNDNPCLRIERNKEKARDREVTWDDFDAVYGIADVATQCAMDLAWMTGLREGIVLRVRLADFKDDGLHAVTNKRAKRVVFEWTDDLRRLVERARSARGKVTSVYLICNREGQPYTQSGFQSNWRRHMQKALKRELIKAPYTFHDLRSLAADESANPTELLQHDDPRTTRRVYRRRAVRVRPNVREE